MIIMITVNMIVSLYLCKHSGLLRDGASQIVHYYINVPIGTNYNIYMYRMARCTVPHCTVLHGQRVKPGVPWGDRSGPAPPP